MLLGEQAKGYLMGVSSIPGDGGAQAAAAEALGIVTGHAYSLLAVVDVRERLVKLRNPWGRKEW